MGTKARGKTGRRHPRSDSGRVPRRSNDILAFIEAVRRATGAPPTVREIGQRFGIRSTNGVEYHLRLLERERLIHRRKNLARGIAIVSSARVSSSARASSSRDSSPALRSSAGLRSSRTPRSSTAFRGIPILGRIAAGEPLFADERFDERFDMQIDGQVDERIGGHLAGHLDGDSLARLGCDFALRVQGTSMIGAGILPGDLVLVRRDSAPPDGDIVVALIGDEATVKRLFREPGRVVLQAENPDFPPIVIDASSPPARILGRVMGVYREMR